MDKIAYLDLVSVNLSHLSPNCGCEVSLARAHWQEPNCHVNWRDYSTFRTLRLTAFGREPLVRKKSKNLGRGKPAMQATVGVVTVTHF